MLTLIVIMMMGLLSQNEGHQELKECQVESLQCYKAANVNLLAQRTWYGLGDLQQASSLLANETDPASALLRFFIAYSQIVAYDGLSCSEQTKQAMYSFIQSFETVGFALEKFGGKEKTMHSKSFSEMHREDLVYLRKLAYFTSSDSLKQFADSFSSTTEHNYAEQYALLSKFIRSELEQDVEYFKKLAYLAPTQEVQRLLFILVEALSETPAYFEESFNQKLLKKAQ